MKKGIWFVIILLLAGALWAQTVELPSPDGQTRFVVSVENGISHSVYYHNVAVITASPFSLEFAQSAPLCENFTIEKQSRQSVNETWKPVYGKHAVIANHYNELTLVLRETRFPGRALEMIYRAYDDGVAFRYRFPDPTMQEELKLKHEYTSFVFNNDHPVWMADYNSFTTSQEKEFRKAHLSDIGDDNLIGLPLLVNVDDKVYAAITEANLTDWAALYLTEGRKRDGGYALESVLAPIPGSSGEDADLPLLAKIHPPAASPWRVIMLSEQPAKLLESEIIMNLNEPNQIKDTSWIVPGKCAWDGWWTGKRMSNELLKEYIDFASYMGFPYQLVDGGWYWPDVVTVSPRIDLDGIRQYAADKNVKLWVWNHWTSLDTLYEKAFALYEQWGIVGVKIDFMDHDDQTMVNWYRKILKCAAEHHLMINFHGAYKPTGVRRTWPNVMAREGVLGNEYNKWSDRVTPEHTVTVAYTRNLLGEMDFTIGGFRNRAMGKFRATSPTEVQGTRCHQMAMFVVYESPVTFVCDNPSNYYDQPGLDFLKVVPTVWDDIVGVNGSVGEYITIAKKSGDDWYLGSMTDSEARHLDVKLDFLDNGSYTAEIWQDAADADVNAEHLEKRTITVKKDDVIRIDMAPGGGYVARLVKK